ncbi:hypothetical protein [Spirillospora sp. NPDC048819]|uniref:hypothetical protein n=1 Tax=Spirillospora sp. NPDC048819 TaxID=3155268 RepID=UPI0033F33F2D
MAKTVLIADGLGMEVRGGRHVEGASVRDRATGELLWLPVKAIVAAAAFITDPAAEIFPSHSTDLPISA